MGGRVQAPGISGPWGDDVARVLRMPEVADDPTVATLTAWLVGESGDFAGAQSIATVETDTSLVSIEVAEPGVLIKSLVQPGDPVSPGSPLAVLGAPGEVVDDVEQLMVELGLAVAPEAARDHAHLRAVPPHDPLYATTWPPHAEPDVADDPVDAPADDVADDVAEETADETADEPVVVRRVVDWADTLAEAVVDQVRAVVPRLVGTVADVPGVPAPPRQVQVREVVRADQLSAVFTEVDSVTLVALVVKAVAVTSRRLPLRSDVASPTDVALLHWTEAGPVAPVIRVANLMTVSSLTTTLADVASRARDGRLATAELEPAAVTIVDLGADGIGEATLEATASHPAVLTVGALREQPVVERGEIVPGTVMNVALSCDASRISGAVAARWLAHLTRLLEQPLLFLT